MVDQFSESLVERAWQRSGGRCECEKTSHGHIGRCDQMLLKTFRGDRNSGYGWEAHSISKQHLNELSDIEILCWNPCYRLTI